MKQTLPSQNLSQSNSILYNLSINTKKSLKSDSIQQNENIIQSEIQSNNLDPNQYSIVYSIIYWIVIICSLIASITTILITRNFYLIEILSGIDLQNTNSILQAIKLYALSLITLATIISLSKMVSHLAIFASELRTYQHRSIQSFTIFLFLCLFLYFTVKQASPGKQTINKTIVKICHFCVWFVWGQISAFLGFIFGSIIPTKSLRTYGETHNFLCYVLLISSIVSTLLNLEWDLFDIMG